MKKSLILIFLCLTFISGPAHAQASLFLGFGLESNILAAKNLPRYQSRYIAGPSINLGLKINNDLTFESRWGILISDEITGGELGFYARKNIFGDFLYAVGGINFYDNSENSHGNLINEDSYGGSHAMLGGGLGVHSPDDFFLEVQYLKTLDDKFGQTSYWDGQTAHTSYWTVNGFVKISLGYNFSLISKRGKEKAAGEEKPALEKKETEESAVETPTRRRHLFFSGGTGFPDILNTQLGYQFTDNLSVAGILSKNIYENQEFRKFAAGLRLTGYFSGYALNNVSLEYGKQLQNFLNRDSEGPVVLTIGNDKLISDSRFHFFWAAGVMSWFNKHGNTERIFPVIKIGTTLNLF